MQFTTVVAFFGLLAICFLTSGSDGSYLSDLHIQAPGDRKAKISDYGAKYGENKRRHVDALKRAGVSGAEIAMAVAIGMQETNTFHPNDGDQSKKGEAANYSAFNFNGGCLKDAGVRYSMAFNTWGAVDEVAAAYKKLVSFYGVNGLLNYHRGGSTAWKDGHSYDAAGYRNAIASMIRYIDQQPSLLHDNRRIDMETGYQG